MDYDKSMGVSHSDPGAHPEPAKAGPTEPGCRRWGLKLLMALALVVLLFGLWVADIILVQHNFHVVSAGLVYRSAQVNASDLARLVQDHRIKSILNLRGGARNGVADWYMAETNTAHQLGVQYYDFELSASHELTDAELDKLVTIVRSAPKPLLIHCKSGADRTGLAGALYLYCCEGKSAETADRELDILHGHVPYLFWRNTAAMDHSFWRYVGRHAPSNEVQPEKENAPLTKQAVAAISAAAH